MSGAPAREGAAPAGAPAATAAAADTPADAAARARTRLARRVGAVGFADAVGLGMYLALSALFLDQAVGLAVADVGLVLGVAGVASLLGAMPIARAAQRHGLRAGLALLFVARAGAFLLLASVGSFGMALLAAVLTGLMSRGTAPLVEAALIEGLDHAGAVRALARLRMLRNAGFAAGGLPAGLAVWAAEPWAYRSVVGASALLFAAAALACWRLPDHALRPPKPAGAAARVSGRILGNRPFVALTALYGTLTLSALVLSVGLPLWIVHRSQAPVWIVGSIQLVNTLLVVLLQDWASRGTDRLPRALAHLRRGGLIAAAACALLALVAVGGTDTGAAAAGTGIGAWIDAVAVLAAVVAFTLAELYIVAGGEGAALLHIPPGEQPTYLAAFNLGFAAATVVGPPLVALGAAGPAWIWLAWGGVFGVAALLATRLPAPSATVSASVAATGADAAAPAGAAAG